MGMKRGRPRRGTLESEEDFFERTGRHSSSWEREHGRGRPKGQGMRGRKAVGFKGSPGPMAHEVECESCGKIITRSEEHVQHGHSVCPQCYSTGRRPSSD